MGSSLKEVAHGRSYAKRGMRRSRVAESAGSTNLDKCHACWGVQLHPDVRPSGEYH